MIRVRRAGLTDILNVYNCNSSVLPLYYGINDYFMFVTISTDKEVLVAEDENQKLCGYLVAEYSDSNIHILSIGVYPECRRMGVGSKLINELNRMVLNENKNKNPKIKTMSLYVHAGNSNAIKLYEKTGFSKRETIKDYYKGIFKAPETSDAYKMDKPIA